MRGIFIKIVPLYRLRKKHMTCRKKYKPYILKYKALISKYMPYIFRQNKYVVYNDLRKPSENPFANPGIGYLFRDESLQKRHIPQRTKRSPMQGL